MADIPGGADARVVIKVDVDDVAAKAKLQDLSRRLNRLEKDTGKTSKSFKTAADRLEDVGSSAARTTKNLTRQATEVGKIAQAYDRFMGRMREMNKLLGVIGSGFGALFKIIKIGAVEFGLLTAAVGAFKIALVSAQYIAKGWNAIIRGVGASAGVAVAAIASVFAAIRELQVAQMAPAYTGNGTVGGRAGQILGDRKFGMFDQQTLNSIMQQQMASGNKVDAGFQRRLGRLGDFTGGDAKTLQSLNQTFNDMQKKGKVTSEGYASLQKSSPALARAFEEMAGGAEKAAAAAASGSISFDSFNQAVMKGELEALKPYNDALERINDTLIGRLKGSVVSIREQFVDLGDDLLVGLKGPIQEVERAFSKFLFTVTPVIQRVFPQMMADTFGAGTSVLDKFLTKLSVLINTNMPKLIGYGGKLRDSWRSFREALSGVGEYMERMTSGFDTLWNAVLRPLFEEIGTTFNYILDAFNQQVNDSQSALERMGEAIRGVFNFIRRLVDVFNSIKPILQTFAMILLQIVNVIGRGLGAGGLLGGFMRLSVGLGLLLGIFGKFIGKTAAFLRGAKDMYARLGMLSNKQKEAGTAADAHTQKLNAESAALQKVASNANAASAAVSGLARSQAVAAGVGGGRGPATMPPSFYGPNAPTYGTSGYGLSARRAAHAGYYKSLTLEQRQQGLNESIARGRASMISNAPVQAADSAGLRMAKSFTKGIVKYNTGLSIAGGVLGGLITGMSGTTNTTGQAIGGALTYGSTGAMIGSMFGPGGALIGGVGGALLGGLLGANSAEQARQQEILDAKEANTAFVNDIYNTGGLFNSKRQISDVRMAAYLARERADTERTGIQLAGNTNILAPSDLYQYGPATDFYNSMGYAVDNDMSGTFTKNGALITPRDFQETGGNYQTVLNDVKTWLSDVGVQASQIDQLISENENLFDVIEQVQEGRLGELEQIVDTSGNLEVVNDRWSKLNSLMHLMDEYSGNLNANLAAGVDIFGESASTVTDMFNEMGISLSETGVTIGLLNKTLGYTGDLANDVAQAAARLREATMAPLDEIRDTNERDRRLRAQLTTYMESGVAGGLSQSEMEDLSADTIEQLLDQQLARIAKGEITFQEAFGEDGTGGYFADAADMMFRQAHGYGVDTALTDVTRGQLGEVQGVLSGAVSNPFERMKYDANFAQEFTRQVELAQAGAMADIVAGGGASSALNSATQGVVTWLESQGFSEVSGDSLYNMISNGALDMARVLEEAQEGWVDAISEGIRKGFGLNGSLPAMGVDERRALGQVVPANAPGSSGSSAGSNVRNTNNVSVVVTGTVGGDIVAEEIAKALRELEERGGLDSNFGYVPGVRT